MTIEFTTVVVAGIAGSLTIVIMRTAMKAMGVNLQMNIMDMLGTMMGAEGKRARILGLIDHIIMGIIFAGFYNIWFDIGPEMGFLALGLIGGFVHWVITGVMLGVMPVKGRAPGMFAKNFGKQDVMGFLLGHLVFGLVVGATFILL